MQKIIIITFQSVKRKEKWFTIHFACDEKITDKSEIERGTLLNLCFPMLNPIRNCQFSANLQKIITTIVQLINVSDPYHLVTDMFLHHAENYEMIPRVVSLTVPL